MPAVAEIVVKGYFRDLRGLMTAGKPDRYPFIHLLRQEDSIKNTQVCKHIGLSINIAHSIEEQFSDSKRVQVINS